MEYKMARAASGTSQYNSILLTGLGNRTNPQDSQ